MDNAQIDQAIAASKAEFLATLGQMIQIQSVRGPEVDHASFGVGPRAALTTVSQLAKQFGFKSAVVDDAMAYAQWGDDDTHYLGIVGHLDVVPAGDGWLSDPWTLTKRGDRWYARGVLDNKGPIMSVLWGMKLLKDLGFKPKRTIRVIFGSDEESGSHDVPRYLAHAAAPEFGWTPDGKYPAVYGERGIVNYRIDTPITDDSLDQISDISGDMAMDHVPDDLQVMVNQKAFSYTGKRVPSNAPELGENALTALAKDLPVSGQLRQYLQWLATSLYHKHYGEGLGLDFSDPDSGRLIVTPYLLAKTENGIRLDLAIRYPVTFTEAQVTAGLEAAVPARSQIQIVRSIPGILKDKQAPFIQALSQVYADVTGLDGTPVTTTGATYARAMPNIIAFGPSFPGQKGIAHKQDEWMAEADLMMNMRVYMHAMMALSAL